MSQACQRLRMSRDIATVYKRGKRHAHRDGVLFLFYKRPDQKTDPSRLAVIISKKYSLKAVKRNKRRRVIQAAMNTHCKNLVPGYDMIISCAQGGKVLSYKDLEIAIKDTLKQHKLLINLQ